MLIASSISPGGGSGPPPVVVPPLGASLFGFTRLLYSRVPTLADVGFTTSANTFLYSGVVGINNPSSPPDPSHFGISNGFLCMKQLGDGVSVNMSTQRLNATVGPTPYCLGANGFYMQATTRCSAYTQDAHMAVWTLPMEHNLGSPPLDVLPIPPGPVGSVNYEGWGEIDFMESSFGSYPQNLNTFWDHHGVFSNLAAVASTTQVGVNFTTASQSWPAGLGVGLQNAIPGGFSNQTYYFVLAAGLTSTNVRLGLTPGGPAISVTSSANTLIKPGYQNNEQTNTNVNPVIDYTLPHVFGGGYSPASKLGYMTQDNVLLKSYSSVGFDNQYNSYHYPLDFSAQSRGANTQYLMEVQQIQVWVPP
jgi:hypothetical protein